VPIELVETRISPDLLDTIGKSFKFRHGAGIAEWLKNALDNYLRLRALGVESQPGAWPVLIDLIDGPPKRGPNLAVIDFGGTTLADIQEFFLHWGSRAAASLGHQIDEASLTGGHGNGGKFYMRQMWREGARFLTFRNALATSLVVQRRDDGKSGYWEFKDDPTDWRTAMHRAFADAEHHADSDLIITYLEATVPDMVEELEAGKRGFTAVVGRRGEQVLSSNDVVVGTKWDRQRLVDALRDTPQARRPIRELAITVLANGSPVVSRLSEDEIELDPAWSFEPAPIPGEIVSSAASQPTDRGGFLEVFKAMSPLTGRQKHRNAITILDSHNNPVAVYPIRELPLPGHSPVLDFLFGELELDFPGADNLVQNEREKLVRSPATDSLLEWLADRVWERVSAVEESQRQSAERKELEIASLLNDELNRHATRFLEELQTQIFVDLVEDPTGGGPGHVGGEGTAAGGSGTGGEGAGGTKEVSGTTEPKRRPRFPQVLLSGYDADPATGGSETKNLTDRHPPLEQDDIDKQHNVWWINTQHVFAQEAMRRGGARGLPFRSYQLHMFRDVVQREALRYRQRREAELSLDRVENELTEMSNRFLGELPHKLISELLD
jgi:hypothetical protein